MRVRMQMFVGHNCGCVRRSRWPPPECRGAAQCLNCGRLIRAFNLRRIQSELIGTSKSTPALVTPRSILPMPTCLLVSLIHPSSLPSLPFIPLSNTPHSAALPCTALHLIALRRSAPRRNAAYQVLAPTSPFGLPPSFSAFQTLLVSGQLTSGEWPAGHRARLPRPRSPLALVFQSGALKPVCLPHPPRRLLQPGLPRPSIALSCRTATRRAPRHFHVGMH